MKEVTKDGWSPGRIESAIVIAIVAAHLISQLVNQAMKLVSWLNP